MSGVKKLQINTDYENIIKFVTYFIFKWENNGWMTVKGTSVKNQALVRELDYWINFLEIKWVDNCIDSTSKIKFF